MPPEAATEIRESPAVRTGRILMLVGGFVLFVAILFGGLGFYYRIRTDGVSIAMTRRDFPAPQLQPNPTQDYVNFRAAQVEQLAGYSWADRAKGLIHIPIERAMALVAARGAKAYDPVQGTSPPADLARTGAPLDGAPRAVPSPGVAPYGATQ